MVGMRAPGFVPDNILPAKFVDRRESSITMKNSPMRGNHRPHHLGMPVTLLAPG
jgi:hypothetical protein